MGNLYLYFSGTGNTRFATERFSGAYEGKAQFQIHSIEEQDVDFTKLILEADFVLISYPIYGSDIPKIMRDFLIENADSFREKPIMTLATQMLFSGDGGALAYYILKPYNVKLLASMHINMPHNIVDFRILPAYKDETVEKILLKASKKIDYYIKQIKSGNKVKTGMRFYSRTLGYLTQRLYYRWMYKSMIKMVRIDEGKCISCLKCVQNCPVGNMVMTDNKILTNNACTLCYRCINICPTQAIRIFGKHYPKQQYFNNKKG